MYGGEQVCFHMWLAKKKGPLWGHGSTRWLTRIYAAFVPPIRLDICPVDRSAFPHFVLVSNVLNVAWNKACKDTLIRSNSSVHC